MTFNARMKYAEGITRLHRLFAELPGAADLADTLDDRKGGEGTLKRLMGDEEAKEDAEADIEEYMGAKKGNERKC